MTGPYQLRPLGGNLRTAQDFHEALKSALDGPPLWGDNPPGDNMRRASWAAEAVETFASRTGIATGETIYVAIQDLLGNIRHLLDLAQESPDDDGYPRTFDELAERSAGHYESEVG